MSGKYRPHRKISHSRGWLRSIAGNVMISAAVGLALLLAACLFANIGGVPRWIWVVGLALCGGLAWAGDRVRTRTIYVDPETGRVEKNNL